MFNDLLDKNDFHANKSVALAEFLSTILMRNPQRSAKRTLPLFDISMEEGEKK